MKEKWRAKIQKSINWRETNNNAQRNYKNSNKKWMEKNSFINCNGNDEYYIYRMKWKFFSSFSLITMFTFHFSHFIILIWGQVICEKKNVNYTMILFSVLHNYINFWYVEWNQWIFHQRWRKEEKKNLCLNISNA